MEYLTHLDLSRNRISGAIPTSLAQMKNLTHLDLSGNRINGVIPKQLFETNLHHLFLQHNRLTGTIPRSIDSCKDLVEVSVSDNKLNGTIPSTLPRKLQVVRFDRNDFTGLLPVESIRNMSNLVEFHADRNRFEGGINDAFSQTSSLEILNVAHNKLNGSVPMLSDLKNLTQIILRDNEFDRVQSNSFARDESLIFLDLSRQRSTSLVLESHSFAHIPSSANLIFTGTAIPVISTNAFQGREHNSLDLSDLSIHTLAPHAFNGVLFVCKTKITHSRYSLEQLALNARTQIFSSHRYAESNTRFDG